MKRKDREAIEKIMNNFDFERVHNVMLHLNWEWYYEGVPSIKELKRIAKHLLEEVCENKWSSTGTGGFFVYRAAKGILTLHFSIEDWDTYE